MTDKTFIDTNILIYFVSDEQKAKVLQGVIFSAKPANTFISTQVIIEFSNACLKKRLLTKNQIVGYIDSFEKTLNVSTVTTEHIKKAIMIKEKYHFSFFDSLILSSAILNNCSVLFTEDMQHKQIIENQITIINPFLK